MQVQFQILILLLIFITCDKLLASDQDAQYLDCTRLFSCGPTVRDIGYPFWGGDRPQECGLPGLQLQCPRDNYTTIDIGGRAFLVLSINNVNNSMKVVQIDLLNDFCPDRYEVWLDENLDGRLMRYTPDVERLTLFYACPPLNVPVGWSNFTCTVNGTDRLGYVVHESQSGVVTGCELNVTIPVLRSALNELRRNGTRTTLGDVVNQGFGVEYEMDGTACAACERSSGLCWSRTNSADQPTCLCRDGPHQFVCPDTGMSFALLGSIAISSQIV
ncbi:LEAF RUST 10 DISEASE-RESISTANCE LOCUS RECEPTOR-LIKE PROTEIN KINASE-like 2.4 [Sesamum alatum]|uniref:non-specific serine/threonine protein kinase n=1 Tax=Sesamum alatum TaxID=300844 RepID=A0AAE1YAZ9_9LAMI|nr:LEAF RUST 10 DISEASE-RESISTANCE LOCUS RECEPTOR-LIKE PROTEIN KINASE-like 2.4 [Sesamum alatum]